eukprot:767271-Hanusia_phi.AAC.4
MRRSARRPSAFQKEFSNQKRYFEQTLANMGESFTFESWQHANAIQNKKTFNSSLKMLPASPMVSQEDSAEEDSNSLMEPPVPARPILSVDIPKKLIM